ncbi:hypothetical protein [Hyphomicrobium sp.]|uniref:hypothetical protein n=1 Tax=Hyphomicrobium sp. TaxID=82 RepID=UPI002E319EC3|nr:hypothetical protein [Hyphomicrobium sp.]HEX2840015.1 hypothetical protein [Hyphomicrobium sp.]
MNRIVTGLILLVASNAPALAGHDRYDDDYYEQRSWRDYRAYYGAPAYRAPAYEVYIPYGYYFADEPDIYGPNCRIERKWRRGYYKERIECDDDD